MAKNKDARPGGQGGPPAAKRSRTVVPRGGATREDAFRNLESRESRDTATQVTQTAPAAKPKGSGGGKATGSEGGGGKTSKDS